MPPPPASAGAPPVKDKDKIDAANPSEDPKERQAAWARVVPTGFERTVWNFLGKWNNPWDFKPQQVIGPYICDFLSRKFMVCLEADGPEHLAKKAEDDKRDKFLESQGILTLRLVPADFVFYTKQQLYHVVEEVCSTKHIILAKELKKGKP